MACSLNLDDATDCRDGSLSFQRVQQLMVFGNIVMLEPVEVSWRFIVETETRTAVDQMKPLRLVPVPVQIENVYVGDENVFAIGVWHTKDS